MAKNETPASPATEAPTTSAAAPATETKEEDLRSVTVRIPKEVLKKLKIKALQTEAKSTSDYVAGLILKDVGGK